MAESRRAVAVEKALTDKGMTLKQGHHKMFRKKIDGVTTVVTRISHGTKDVPTSLGKLMGHQCYLHPKEFWELVDCPLGESRWNELIAERCVDGRNPFLGH